MEKPTLSAVPDKGVRDNASPTVTGSVIKISELFGIGVFSLIFGAVFFFGCDFTDRIGDNPIPSMWIMLSAVIMFSAMTALLWLTRSGRLHADKRSFGRRTWCIIFACLLVAYTLPFLTYFPAVGGTDGVVIMYFGVQSADQFPIFYSLYVTAVRSLGLALGSLGISFAIYTAVQVVVVSLLTLRLIGILRLITDL